MPWLWGKSKAVVAKEATLGRLIRDAEKALIQANNVPPKYIAVHPYSQTEPAYLRKMAEIVDDPCWQFFMYDCREFVVSSAKDAPPQERIAMLGALQTFDILMQRAHALRGEYNALTAAEAGNDESQV